MANTIYRRRFDFADDDDEVPEVSHRRMLPGRMGYASKEEAAELRKNLDRSSLAIIPSSVLNELTRAQEEWLLVRLQTYSDRQACYHLGIRWSTVRSWLRQSAFREAYNLVTLDRLNLQMALDRLLIFRMAQQQLDLLENGPLPVRLKIMELITRRHVESSKALDRAGKTEQNILNIFGGNPFEWARHAAALLDGNKGSTIDDRSRLQAGIEGLLDCPLPPEEFREIHEDPGREQHPDD